MLQRVRACRPLQMNISLISARCVHIAMGITLLRGFAVWLRFTSLLVVTVHEGDTYACK
jgi:hypothetical protein